MTSKQEGVIESVNITSVMNTDWRETESFVIWRVLATMSGVTRFYPGVTENRHYLAVQRNWSVVINLLILSSF